MKSNGRMIKNLIRILLSVVWFVLYGCAVVQPWEREHLSDPILMFDENGERKGLMEQHRNYREGSQGGTGTQGGGCGCG